GVALGQEILRPAVAAIRRAGPARAGRAAAVDHHDREGVRLLLRDLILDVGVSRHHGAVRRVDVFAADEEMALLGDDNRSHPLSRCTGGARGGKESWGSEAKEQGCEPGRRCLLDRDVHWSLLRCQRQPPRAMMAAPSRMMTTPANSPWISERTNRIFRA